MTRQGRLDELEDLCQGGTFDLICCHGVMMYLDDRAPALGMLARHLKDEGTMSVTFRNRHALAMRAGLRGDWSAALSAFGSSGYVNELGVRSTADYIPDIEASLASVGMNLVSWYGVRVFNDAIPTDAPPPSREELDLLLDAEERAGATEPYKWMASQLHVIAAPARKLKSDRWELNGGPPIPTPISATVRQPFDTPFHRGVGGPTRQNSFPSESHMTTTMPVSYR